MGRKALSAVQRFKAQVFAGDPRAIEIQSIITECGFRFVEGSRVGDLGDIKAVAAIERVHNAFGADHLRLTMTAIRDVWYGEKTATDSHMLSGFALFLNQFGDRFDDQHVERLKRVSALTLVRRAQEKTISNSAFSVPAAVCDEIRRATGLRGSVKPQVNQLSRRVNRDIELNTFVPGE